MVAVAAESAPQPEPGAGWLRRIIAYGRKAFDLREGLEALTDARQEPRVQTFSVAAAVFFCGLLRVRSFNALEPKLSERTFCRLIDAPANKPFSADTMGRVVRAMHLETARALGVSIVTKAERNKVFREGWHGALRYVAIDGWEPISSYHRHCPKCLTRNVTVKRRDGTLEEVVQYYHRYVVAMYIDHRFDLTLDFEPLLPADLRPQGKHKRDTHEGELTAAKRLLRRVKQTYGWLDVVVGDALYANGPFLTLVKELRMGAVIIARKETDEPLREALAIWDRQPPEDVIDDDEAGESIELWDCPGLETLSSYKGPIRVTRGRVTDKRTGQVTTWCMAVTGKATKLTSRQVLRVARARWHIENTGFHQWTTRWHFAHVFVKDGHGIQALYWLFFAAYNLLTIFLYRQVRSYGRDRGKDVTRTISRFVDEMQDDLARLDDAVWNTS